MIGLVETQTVVSSRTSKHLLPVLLVLAALIPSAYIAWIGRDMPHLGHFHDDAIYFLGAKSIAEGHGYRIPSFPGEPYQTKFPPLYSTLLAAVWKINPVFPANLPLATLFAWCALPPFLLAARRALVDLKASETEAWILCAVLAASPYVVFTSINLMSELVFCGLLCLALSISMRATSARLVAVAGLIAGAAYLTRTAALPLLIAVPLWFATRRQWRNAAVFAATMLPTVAGWSLWIKAHAAQFTDPALSWYSDYAAYYRHDVQWSDLPTVLFRNAEVLLETIVGPVFFHYDAFFISVHFKRILTFIAIAGVIRLVRRNGMTPYHWYALGLLPMLLAYHFKPTERYTLPLFPLFLHGFATESAHIIDMLKKAWQKDAANRVVSGFAWAVIAGICGLTVWVSYDTIFRFTPLLLESDRQQLRVDQNAYAWIRGNTAPDARFLAYRDPILYLHTGRRALRRPIFQMPAYHDDLAGCMRPYYQLVDFALVQKTQYILATALDFNMDLPFEKVPEVWQHVESDPRARKVYATPGNQVFQVK
jgi:hypothetical protein